MGVYYGKADFITYGVPSLFLDFANKKSLVDRISGNELITFSRSSTGTYVDSDGLIKTADINTPRYDHNSTTGICNGLLIEESRTNAQKYSNTFSNVGLSGTDSRWGSDSENVSLQENLYSDPFGTNTATRVIPTTTNGSHYIGRYMEYTGATAYAGSIFVKPAGYSRLLISQNLSTFTVNLSGSGSFSNNNSITYATKIQSFSNGWYRIEWVWDNLGGAGANTNQPRITILNDSGSSTFAGDGVSGIDIFGFQMEFGLFSTSYIPTTTATVTRSRDIASITGSNFTSWYNNSEGTVLFDAALGESINSTVSIVFGNYLWATAPNVWRTSGNQGIMFPTSSSRTTRTKHAFRLQQNNHAFSVNGGSVVPASLNDSTSPLSSGPVSFNNNGTTLNGYISRITYWPRSFTNSQLQSMTA